MNYLRTNFIVTKLSSLFFYLLIPFSLIACSMDLKISELLSQTNNDPSPATPFVFIEKPNQENLVSEAGTTNLLLLADPEFYTEMYITNVAGCTSGGIWEPYSTSKAGWILSDTQANSKANVYVKFRNTAQTIESECISHALHWTKPINICGAVISSSDAIGGISDSGGNSNNYADNEDCSFSITSTSDITLNIESVSLESGSDYLKIYDGDSATGNLLRSFSGDSSAVTLKAKSGLMTVKFTSNGANNQAGFSMWWKSGTASLSSFTINDGSAYTENSAVTLKIGASVTLPEMYVTNTPLCTDGGSWEATATTKAWNLEDSTNGEKNVFIKFRNIYNQESPCESASIILGTPDNCLLENNPNQRDTDGDGFGNICDADLNNDNVIDGQDLTLLQSKFLCTTATNPGIDLCDHADFNGDNVVNNLDVGILKKYYDNHLPPGPKR